MCGAPPQFHTHQLNPTGAKCSGSLILAVPGPPYLMRSAVHTGVGFHILQGLVVEVLQRISMMYVA